MAPGWEKTDGMRSHEEEVSGKSGRIVDRDQDEGFMRDRLIERAVKL